jgi:hypothetical protein
VVTDPQHLYDQTSQERVETRLLNIPASTGFIDPFTNLAAGALILSPLARVNLLAGSAIEALLSLALIAGALLIAVRLLAPVASRPLRLLIAVSAVLSLSAVSAVIQWDSLMAAALLGSVLLAERRHYVWAGVLLATLVLKPQVVWLVVPALVAAGSWRYLEGLLLGIAGWIGVSLLAAGPHALLALGQVIAQTYPGQAGNSVGLPSLVSDVTGSGSLGFVVAAGLGVLATVLLMWRRRALDDRPVVAVALGIALSLLCAPHVSAEDLMLVTLPVVVLARHWPMLALSEALAFSVVEFAQLQLPPGDRHFEPFVLAALTITLVLLIVRPRHLVARRTSLQLHARVAADTGVA